MAGCDCGCGCGNVSIYVCKKCGKAAMKPIVCCGETMKKKTGK